MGDRRHALRRSALACIVLLLVLGVAPTAPAVDRFEPGSVQARAQSARVGGFIGGTEAIISFGRAIARSQGQQGNSQAQAVDLGLFGLILSQPNGCTGRPPLPPEQLPKPVRVSSVQGDRSATHTAVADGRLVRGGTEYAAATTKPSGSARTDVGELDLPGVLSLDGLHSIADASITASSARRDSSASTAIGAIDLAGGVVRLEGLEWTTTKTTGRGARSQAVFTVGHVLVSGVALPASTPAQLADAFAAASGVLAPFGLKITEPSIKKAKDGTLEVTPLVVEFGGNDRVNPLLGPLLRTLQPVRDQLFALSQDSGCPVDPTLVNAAFTVADLGLAGVTGSGGLVLELGGVKTLHDTRVFESPLLDIPPFVAPPFVAPPVQPVSPTVKQVPGKTTTQAQPGVAGRTSTRCTTTHPSGHPGCSNGRATLAGGLAILAVLALLGADLWRSRRHRIEDAA